MHTIKKRDVFDPQIGDASQQGLLGHGPGLQNRTQAILAASRKNVSGVHIFGENGSFVGIGNCGQTPLDVLLHEPPTARFRKTPQKRGWGVPRLPEGHEHAVHEPPGERAFHNPLPEIVLFLGCLLWNTNGAQEQQPIDSFRVFFAVGNAQISAHGVARQSHLVDLIFRPPGL
ncbi:unnamed protein product [Pseudo-nitzschia multistriata]|uniref:Uncharacterized protein n=1 Tax=Pseudo-nitzschia multistriata TaxID=183589 RepID=A0A448Z1F1_9STRA|nr:unnamed protein product [Pseudo-nitzschia multistriata]